MKLRLDFQTVVLACTLLLFTTGHSGSCCAGEDDVRGPPTGAECPPASTLTYDNFGQPFMANYCTRCHSSTLSGADRMGATADHDFDSKIGVLRVYDHVDQTAGAGPNATNDQMPPNGAMPNLEERKLLAEWLACGLP